MTRARHPIPTLAMACACAFAFQAARAESPSWPVPLAAYSEGEQACIAIHAPQAGLTVVHNPEQCQQRLAPCSTFKVPNALAGLEAGVLAGPGDLKAWDGTAQAREVLNQDHDLSSAMKYSVVWYFQDVALDIGPERMQAALDAFAYGNRDISGGQDRFWLDSSLQISAFEQIRFMQGLAQGTLPASAENQAMVRGLIRQDYELPEAFRGELYGKTGSCIGPQGDFGWFVGFLDRDAERFVFAINLKGPGMGGWDARTLAVEVLHAMQ